MSVHPLFHRAVDKAFELSDAERRARTLRERTSEPGFDPEALREAEEHLADLLAELRADGLV
jgi:hypothetical protein